MGLKKYQALPGVQYIVRGSYRYHVADLDDHKAEELIRQGCKYLVPVPPRDLKPKEGEA